MACGLHGRKNIKVVSINLDRSLNSIISLWTTQLPHCTCVQQTGTVSLMTSHTSAKRLSSIQTGLMVSLSYWLEWRAIKWLHRLQHRCYRRGNSCIPRANRDITITVALREKHEQKLSVFCVKKYKI